MSEATRTEIFASASVSTAANTASFSVPTAANLFVGIDLTAYAAAGPVFFFQASDDGGTTWYDYPVDVAVNSSNSVSANQISIASGPATGHVVMVIKNIAADRYRVRWTVASGSATFSISVVAK